MTHYTERNLNQIAVYWGNPTNDGSGGYSYADPVELDCRWESVDTVSASSIGLNYVVEHEVQVAQDLDKDGMMLLGTIDSIGESDLSVPERLGAKRIVKFDKIPDLKATHFFRKAYLGKYK